jgi:sugar/nucleoside kinase (ribokinase family)
MRFTVNTRHVRWGSVFYARPLFILLFCSCVVLSENTKRVLTIGGATKDIFIEYDNASSMQLISAQATESYLILKEGGKLEIKNLSSATGGGATNAAVSFKRLGFSTSIFCKLGTDQFGKDVVQDLVREDVDVSNIVYAEKEGTGISFIIPSLDGDRTVFSFRGANVNVQERDFPFEQLCSFDCLYITSLSGKFAQLLSKIVQEAKKHNLVIAVNPGSGQLCNGASVLQKAFAYIDILILNSEEAQLLMQSLAGAGGVEKVAPEKQTYRIIDAGHHTGFSLPALLQGVSHTTTPPYFNLKHFLTMVFERGVKVIVVTNGSEGAYVALGNTLYFHPSIPAKLCNTLGAGDAFGSTFVASFLAHDSIAWAMRDALINSSSVIEYLDAKTGLLSLKEIQDRFQEIDPLLLQKFSLS